MAASVAERQQADGYRSKRQRTVEPEPVDLHWTEVYRTVCPKTPWIAPLSSGLYMGPHFVCPRKRDSKSCSRLEQKQAAGLAVPGHPMQATACWRSDHKGTHPKPDLQAALEPASACI